MVMVMMAMLMVMMMMVMAIKIFCCFNLSGERVIRASLYLSKKVFLLLLAKFRGTFLLFFPQTCLP